MSEQDEIAFRKTVELARAALHAASAREAADRAARRRAEDDAGDSVHHLRFR